MVDEQTAQADSEAGGRRRSLRVLLILLGVAVLLAVWAAAAGVSVLSAYGDLQQARSDAGAAERLLRDAELSEARDALADAIVHAEAASDQLNRPYVVPLRWVPVAGPNLRVATTLADGAHDGGTAAADLLDVAAVIVSDDRTQDPGEISITYLRELGPPARTLADTLEETFDRLEATSDRALLGRVEAARTEFLELVGPNLEQAVLAADLLEVMPRFLGEDGPRTYLLGAGALSELRGSGGLLGSWSMLTIDEGRMEFDDFVDVDELPAPDGDVTAPSQDHERRYQPRAGLREWRQVNFTPHFPSAAEVMLELWEDGGNAPVDGVIVADTVVFERLAARAGGLTVPGVGTFGPDEILRFVGLDAYDVFDDEDERKAVLGAVATSAFAEIFEILEDDDVPRTVEMLLDLADGGHVNIYTRDDRVQEVFGRADVDGALPTEPGESPGVFVNNTAQNKVDWFTDRWVDHRIELLPGGATRSTITVGFANEAPTEGFSRGVIGPWRERTEAGDNLSVVTFTCSVSCEVVRAPETASDGGTELGRPMWDSTELVPAGGQHELTFVTETAEGWHLDEGPTLVVDVDHLAQPTLRGVDLRVGVAIPTDTTVVAAPDGATERDGHVMVDQRASGRTSFRFVFDGQDLPVEAGDR